MISLYAGQTKKPKGVFIMPQKNPKITGEQLVNVWKTNKNLSLCVICGLILTIVFFLVFKEILWMGIFCFAIGAIGLYRKTVLK